MTDCLLAGLVEENVPRQFNSLHFQLLTQPARSFEYLNQICIVKTARFLTDAVISKEEL